MATEKMLDLRARRTFSETLKAPRTKKAIGDTFTYIILTIGGFLSLFPLLWMISSSLKPAGEIFSGSLWIQQPTLKNFIDLFREENAWQGAHFGQFFYNSLFVCFFTVTLGLFFDSLAGFALAKGKFMGKDQIFWVILATLMIPVFVTLVPTVIVAAKLKIFNKLWGLIFPGLAGAIGIFVMTQNIRNVPDSIIEAAKVDGCHLFGIYRHAVMPVVTPALAAVAIFRFMGSWNSYLFPLIMINSERKMTIPLGIQRITQVNRVVLWGALMAGSVIATLPIIIFFMFMQKQFISGLTLGSVKE